MTKLFLSHKQPHQRIGASSRKQQGVVLFVALIVLVAMSLAGVSLMRAVDTGTQVAGNLASRQSAINAADQHFETALRQIMNMVADGTSRFGGAAGYSPVALSTPVEARNWANSYSPPLDPITGNQVNILIDRVCTATDCEITQGKTARAINRPFGMSQFRPRYQHFRTIARVTDPKGMVTYIEFKS